MASSNGNGKGASNSGSLEGTADDNGDFGGDEAAWARVGRDLKRFDPQRYQGMLRVAREIVSIYRDPLGAADLAIAEIGKPKKSDDFD